MCFCLENWAVRLLHKATGVVSFEKKTDITAVSNRKFNNMPLKMTVNCRKKIIKFT